jgi:hypothetical protein
MVIAIKDHYKVIKKMDKDNIAIILDKFIKEYLKKDSKMAMAKLLLIMEMSIKECGKMG